MYQVFALRINLAARFFNKLSFLIFLLKTNQSDSAQPDRKLEYNPTVKATILTQNSDSAVWRPILWGLSEMPFHASLKGP